MAKLRFGAIGTGNIFRVCHVEPVANHPDAKWTAFCDIVPEKAKPYAQKFKTKHCFKDYHDLLKLSTVDAVDICTPNVYHSQIAVAALEAGKHVFCEKPDAVSASEAARMRDAAKASGKVLMVMRNNRFRPEVRWLRQQIQAGAMGEIYTGRCGWIRRRGIPGKGGWFTTKALSGGGPLIDLGVHMLDLAVWLMGDPTPVAVTGATYRKFADAETSDSVHVNFGEKKAGGTFDVEDLATGFVRFANGATLQIEFSWASNIEVEKNFVELRGTKAGFNLDSSGPLKVFTDRQGAICDLQPRTFPQLPARDHPGHLHHFIDCVLGRDKPINTPQDGLNMIKILTAVYQSAQEGKEVRL
jgi:predicted dehydrogenase